MATGPLPTWFSPRASHALRSVTLVRIVTALVLVAHPLNALAHPGAVEDVGQRLADAGLPLARPLGALALVALVACSLALLVGRVVVPACVGAILVLLGGIAFLYAPYWYVAGGEVVDGHPGVELNVLLIACLSGILWTWLGGGAPADREARARTGLGSLVTSAALLLLPHALAPFVTRDVEGMREWGHGMTRLGFPFGVPLVWGVVSLQVASSLALLARRFMVPACLGHILVLSNGLWIAHAPHWFMIYPQNNGMEFPVMFLACFVAGALSYWPVRQTSLAVTEPTLAG